MLHTLDRFFPPLVLATTLALMSALGLIFFYAPVEQTMGVVQKIFYVHVPAAMAMYAGFTICSAASLAFLIKPANSWDTAAKVGADIGMLFAIFVMISGPLWGYKAWGKAWVWDPQLTATFILVLLYGGYILLRKLSPDTRSIQNIAAVLAVFAFVDIPIIHFAVQKWGGLHPTVERAGGGGLAPAMKTTFSVSMLAFLLLFVTMTWALLRMRTTKLQIDQLHLEAESLRLAHS